MNNKKYHRKIMNKSNKDWTNQNNQTKVELAYMLHSTVTYAFVHRNISIEGWKHIFSPWEPVSPPARSREGGGGEQ